MTPHQAELNAAEQMRAWGYVDAVATTGGSDGGIDVRSSKAYGQVKYYQTSLVGRPDLQRLYGARAGESTKRLLFFAYGGRGGQAYTRQALDYANHTSMALYIYDASGQARPVNAPAKRFMIGDATPIGHVSAFLGVSIPTKPFIIWLIGLFLSFAVIALTLLTKP